MKHIVRYFLLTAATFTALPLVALRKRPKSFYENNNQSTLLSAPRKRPKHYDENDQEPPTKKQKTVQEGLDFAWGFCTHHKPTFVRRTVKTPFGRTKEVHLIDVGNNQTIPAGKDFDPQRLADADPRMTIDFDIKTRRVYTCDEIDDPTEVNNLQVECKLRGYDHGVMTNGSEECFNAW